MELDEARKQRPKYCVFFFNDTATTEIYTLSLHDALPIYDLLKAINARDAVADADDRADFVDRNSLFVVLNLRSEEHTSELQSQSNLVCRLLLEEKTIIRHCDRSMDLRATLLHHLPTTITS